MSRTIREQVAEMTQVILSEGAANSADLAALACVRAGFPPRLVAACLDQCMEAAREMQRPIIISKTPAWLRRVQ